MVGELDAAKRREALGRAFGKHVTTSTLLYVGGLAPVPRRDRRLGDAVADLDAMLAQLRATGVPVDDKIEVMEGVGRFGWATDPEGNRFELWEPATQE